LGTTRVVSDAAQALQCQDYLPFGAEIGVAGGSLRDASPCYGADLGVRQRFTGHVRDQESGLDFMLARYYSAAQGRFTSPDAPFADQKAEDSQSWNLYGYGRNNPLRFVDPSGSRVCPPEEACLDVDPAASTPTKQVAQSPAQWQNRLAAMGTSDFWSGLWTGGTMSQQTSLETGEVEEIENSSATPAERLGQEAADNIRGLVESPLGQIGLAMVTPGRGGRPGKPNGNKAGNQPAELYMRFDKEGVFQKWGISQDAGKRYSPKLLGDDVIKVVDRGPRIEMLKKERQHVETNPGPMNREPWAGKQKK
jgi:RHS repeat-associated protein